MEEGSELGRAEVLVSVKTSSKQAVDSRPAGSAIGEGAHTVVIVVVPVVEVTLDVVGAVAMEGQVVVPQEAGDGAVAAECAVEGAVALEGAVRWAVGCAVELIVHAATDVGALVALEVALQVETDAVELEGGAEEEAEARSEKGAQGAEVGGHVADVCRGTSAGAEFQRSTTYRRVRCHSSSCCAADSALQRCGANSERIRMNASHTPCTTPSRPHT